MQLQSGTGNEAEIGKVRDWLAMRGCGRGAPARAERRERQGVVFRYTRDARSVFPSDEVIRDGRRSRRMRPDSRDRGGSPLRSAPVSTVRTLCVRSCDGYYFPISFATTRDRLEEDRNVCRRMCPAVDAELFYHATREQGPEDMVSVDGMPYSELENAFRYRSVFDDRCSCGAAVTADADETALALSVPDQVLPPTPRPGPAEDPETAQNRAGDFDDPHVPADDAAGSGTYRKASVRVILPALSTSGNDVLISSVPN